MASSILEEEEDMEQSAAMSLEEEEDMEQSADMSEGEDMGESSDMSLEESENLTPGEVVIHLIQTKMNICLMWTGSMFDVHKMLFEIKKNMELQLQEIEKLQLDPKTTTWIADMMENVHAVSEDINEWYRKEIKGPDADIISGYSPFIYKMSGLHEDSGNQDDDHVMGLILQELADIHSTAACHGIRKFLDLVEQVVPRVPHWSMKELEDDRYRRFYIDGLKHILKICSIEGWRNGMEALYQFRELEGAEKLMAQLKNEQKKSTMWTIEDVKRRHDVENKRVNLSYCKLENIPEVLYTFVNSNGQVETIELTGNRIKHLDTEIFKLKDVNCLYLEGNPLACIPVEVMQSSLKEIRMNPFTLVWSTAAVRQYITNLMWPPTKIQQYYKGDEFQLSMPFCDLTCMPLSITQIAEVKEIDLKCNLLDEIHPDISACQNLRSLDVAENRLTDLHYNLADCLHLQKVTATENHRLIIPSTVLDGGVPQLCAYLKDRKKSSSVCNSNRRVVIFGKFGAGKTSFLQTMLAGKSILTEEHQRTEVAEQHQITEKIENGKLLSIHFDDLGGQEPYLETFKLFWNEECLYILTINSSEFQEMDAEDYFRNHILTHVDDLNEMNDSAKLIFVLTQIDKLDETDKRKISKKLEDMLDKDFQKKVGQLKRKIDECKEAYDAGERPPGLALDINRMTKERSKLTTWKLCKPLTVSSKTLTGISEAKTTILKALVNERIFPEKQIPQTWQTFRDQLKGYKPNAKPPWLTMDEVAKLGHAAGLSTDTIMSALAFLVACGDIFWYDEDRLRDHIFHEPANVIKLIATVINPDIEKHLDSCDDSYTPDEITNFKQRIKNRGEISIKMLSHLWKTKFNITEETDILISLLEKLEFCYRVGKVMRFPYLLTSEETEITDWKEISVNTKEVTMRIQFVRPSPKTFFNVLSVRLHQFAKFHHHWKNGFYFRSQDNNKAKVELKKARCDDVLIAIRGEEVNSLWNDALRINNEAVSLIKEKWPGCVFSTSVYAKTNTCPCFGFLMPAPWKPNVCLPDEIKCQLCYEPMSTYVQLSPDIHDAKQQRFRDFLKHNREDFARQMTLEGHLLNSIYGSGVISRDQLEKIQQQSRIRKEKAEILLNILERKTTPAIERFFRALQKDEEEASAAEVLKRLDPNDYRDIFGIDNA